MASWGGCAINRLRGKALKPSADADDINQAVDRANLMEVNLIRGAAVHRGFRISQVLKHLQNLGF
jgi:hypothetical protein